MVIDNKGREIVYKVSEKTTNGERNKYISDRGRIWHRGRDMDQLKFEHTIRGSKLINLVDAFECAFHMLACMAQVLNLKFHACVVYASCGFEWWNEKLACIGWVTRLVFIL